MKKFLFAISTALISFAGCNKVIDIKEGTGNVSFSISNDNAGYVTKAELPAVDVNTFKISLASTDGTFSQEWESYSEMPSVLELVSGNYTVTATSPDPQPVGDKPIYSGTKNFAVMVGKVSNVDLVCSITNMMVSINPSADFLAELTEFEITVKSNDGSIIWTKEDVEAGKPGFFAVSPLEVWVKGTRHNGQTAPQQYLSITDVAAKDHHILNLDAKVTGEADFSITVDNTVNDRNENIDVPGFEEIPVPGGGDGGNTDPDPEEPQDAPTLTWEANPTFAPTPLAETMDVNIIVNAPKKVKTFQVKVESPTAAFLSTVGALVSAENNHSTETEPYVMLDLTGDATAIGNLGGLIPAVAEGLAGMTEVQFSLSTLVPMINRFSPESGTEHIFSMIVTDEAGQNLTQSLSFVKE